MDWIFLAQDRNKWACCEHDNERWDAVKYCCLLKHCSMQLFFSMTPECVNAFNATWHKLEVSLAVRVGHLHSQPFANSDFHFLMTGMWPRFGRCVIELGIMLKNGGV